MPRPKAIPGLVVVYSLNLLQIHQLTPRQWQSGQRKRRREREAGMQRGSDGKGGRVPRQRGGHFIKRRPSCGQINAFPLRTNKFPRDADDDGNDNNKCQQKTKFFSLSLFLLHHHLLVVVELLLVPLLLLHFWLPTALARLGAKHGQQQS